MRAPVNLWQYQLRKYLEWLEEDRERVLPHSDVVAALGREAAAFINSEVDELRKHRGSLGKAYPDLRGEADNYWAMAKAAYAAYEKFLKIKEPKRGQSAGHARRRNEWVGKRSAVGKLAEAAREHWDLCLSHGSITPREESLFTSIEGEHPESGNEKWDGMEWALPRLRMLIEDELHPEALRRERQLYLLRDALGGDQGYLPGDVAAVHERMARLVQRIRDD